MGDLEDFRHFYILASHIVVMLSLLAFERISKKAGVKRISKEAVEELRDVIEEAGTEIAEKAVRVSRHAGRRTIMAQDVKFVHKTEE